MATNPTLRDLMSLPQTPAPLGGSALVMIDLQQTYTEGVLALDGVAAAIDAAAQVLDRARAAGTPVFHLQHDAGPGSPFDPAGDSGQIVKQVAPEPGETVIVKKFPDAFADTDLAGHLTALGTTDLVVVGFMTHLCVNSTTRSAFTRGYRPTVVADATATRALPGPDGREVAAADLQVASLAAISDVFGLVVAGAADLQA